MKLIQRESIQRTAAVMLMMWALCGCGASSKGTIPDGEVPSAFRQPAGAGRTEGSLWTDEQSRTLFFQDAKASHLGDIVTVHIVENAQGSKAAATKSGRSSTISAGTSSFLGVPATTVTKLQAGANFSDAFDGSGSTSRSGALTADVTAVVTAVFPNGNMAIEGKREVLINNEKELISLSGIIRPEDIGTKNTVLSTVIADAKIEYTGRGVLNDKQGQGWLIRLIDWVWPF